MNSQQSSDPTVPTIVSISNTVFEDCSTTSSEVEQSVLLISRNVILSPEACKAGKTVIRACKLTEGLQSSKAKQHNQAVKESREIRLDLPQNWCIIFESYPVWLFSLTTKITQNIFLPQFDSWQTLQDFLNKIPNGGNIACYDAIVTLLG